MNGQLIWMTGFQGNSIWFYWYRFYRCNKEIMFGMYWDGSVLQVN